MLAGVNTLHLLQICFRDVGDLGALTPAGLTANGNGMIHSTIFDVPKLSLGGEFDILGRSIAVS